MILVGIRSLVGEDHVWRELSLQLLEEYGAVPIRKTAL